MRYLIHFVAVFTFCLSMSVAAAQNKVVVVPLGGAVGDAVPGDVVKGKTFSSKAGKGLIGTLELPPEPEVPVVTSSTGQVWMALNLGASQVATSSTDPAAYGTLYQWGRFGDGHEYRTSPTTTTLSLTDVPGHGSFIMATSSSNYDWRSPQNDNLWQGVAGINNPCPSGFRLPTDPEWETERTSWGSNINSAGAFASPLKLVPAGARDINGTLVNAGLGGYYWSSTVGGSLSRSLHFRSDFAGMGINLRAYGFSVRCLKD